MPRSARIGNAPLYGHTIAQTRPHACLHRRHFFDLLSLRDEALQNEPVTCKMDTMIRTLVAEHTRELEQKLAECKQTEEALRESEARYRSLVEESPDLIGIFQEGRLVFINSTGARQIGAKSKDELLGRKTEDFVHPDDVPAAMARLRRRLEGETGMYPAEVRYMRLDGTPLPLEVSAAPTIFRKKIAMQFIARDITERRRAEETLRESERQFRTLFENAPIGIGVIDAAGNVLECNDAALESIGYRREDIKKGVNAVMLYRDLRQREEVLALFHQQGVLKNYPVRWKRKDGSPFDALLSLTPSTFAGKPCVQSLIQDITERKALEEQLRQAQKLDSIGQLAGGVAHDFNNMVQVILGNVDLALEVTPQESPVRESLEEIQKAARRSADLTQQLLAFARKQTISPKVVDLNETVEGLLKMLRRLIGEDIHLAWLPASGLAPVKVDPTQIHQILANLCVNARDAIGGVGKITIDTGNEVFDETDRADHPEVVPGEYARLAVSDNGCGMEKETLAHLFEPFFTTKDVGKGTGLGLAMIYGIVVQNHGFIRVNSEPGKGTTFRIYLPRHAGQNAAAQTGGVAEAPMSRGESVLLVEDEAAIVAIARRVLERLGYTVLTACTPGEAIRLAEAHSQEIQLLMTDVVMPEMNGRDLAARLLSRAPRLKCLFMSGYPDDVIAHHGVLDEGVHFIAKPFSVEDLAAKVREALELA